MKVIQSTKYLQSAVAVSSVGLMVLFAAILVPIYHDEMSAEAVLGEYTDSILTFTSSNSVASVSFEVGSKDGTFATSTEDEKARFAISTNNYTGYTLSIRSNSSNSSLENVNNNEYFESISENVSSDGFEAGYWGYIPSKFNSLDNNSIYIPAPVSGVSATTLAVTNGPNSVNGIDNADEYTIGIGLKADYTRPSGTYTNGAFVIEYTANVTPYNISFDCDTGDNSVADCPDSLSGSNVSSVTITNDKEPTRTGYTFAGKWCLGRTDNNGTICDGTVYNVGDSFGIDRTENNDITLFAMWTPNDYDLTINFAGNGVKSVKVCTESGDCSGDSLKGTVSMTGSNVTLTYGQNYYFYPSLASGYETDGWEVTGTGRISSTLGTDTNPTFAVGADEEQSVTVEGGKVCNPDGSTISDVVCMQDISSTNKTDVFNSMAEGDQYILKDSRDRKKYMVARLADDNIWMTQNLDHNIVATADFYTYNNTDIGHGATKDTSATWTGVATTSGTSWTSSTSTPVSYDPGNLCWNGVLDENWETTLDNGTTACIDGSNMNYSIGNYYNWTAAVAMTNSGSITSGSVDQSICPAGWTLPKGGSNTGSGSFQGLVTPYGWNDDDYTLSSTYKMWNAPLYFPLGGAWGGESWGVGSGGYYWSSTVSVAYSAYSLNFGYDGSVYPDLNDYRYYGISVRCVAT